MISNKEKKAYLKLGLKKYISQYGPFEADEITELKAWVKSGNYPLDNPWHICTEGGYPMDFVNAMRLAESMEEEYFHQDVTTVTTDSATKEFKLSPKELAEIPF